VGPGEISKMNSLIINRVITNSKMIDLHVIDKNAKFSHNPGNLYLLTAQ
jgi:hypothetical protein